MKNHLKILLLIVSLSVACAFAKRTNEVVIYMIGDSTMANKPIAGENPERGWGQALPSSFREGVRVENHAQNGRSTKSFIDEGLWDVVVSRLRPGDYLFIQFGHNDEKEAKPAVYADPQDDYPRNLRKFIDEARAKGAIPVLMTPIVRRNFDTQGKLVDTHGAYPDAVKRVAAEREVTLIDLNKLTEKMVQDAGDDGSKKFYLWIAPGVYPSRPDGVKDDTHLSALGARSIAKLAAEQIKAQIPSLGRYVVDRQNVVAYDGSGDFNTIEQARQALGSGAQIYVQENEYSKEKL